MNKYPDSSNQLAEPQTACRVSRFAEGESRNANLRNSLTVIPISSSVIPAKAGIQSFSGSVQFDDSAKCRDSESRTVRTSPLAWPFLALIYIYRYSVGHWFSGTCRFYPSCSHYGEEAFRKHGAWRGSTMTIKRLSRCHPWHDGGYDPVD